MAEYPTTKPGGSERHGDLVVIGCSAGCIEGLLGLFASLGDGRLGALFGGFEYFVRLLFSLNQTLQSALRRRCLGHSLSVG